MIKSFKNRGLKELFETGKSKRIKADLQARTIRRLDALDSATALDDLNMPGFKLHSLHTKPIRYSIWVNGPWRITFAWNGEDAVKVDLEQYH